MTLPETPRPAPSRALSRRTVTTSALWAPPAISLAAASPAYAKSTQPILFNAAQYSAPNGSRIEDVLVHVDPPVAGMNLEVTLTGGFTFERISRIPQPDNITWVVTGTGGVAVLPNIHVPETGGNGTITVTDEDRTRSASAALNGPTTNARAIAFSVDLDANPIEYTDPWLSRALPGTALSLGGAFFLNENTAYHRDQAIATDIARGISAYGTDLDAVTTSGEACTIDAAGVRTVHPAVPSGSTPVGCGYFLAGEDLYQGDRLLRRGVRAATGYLTASSEQAVDIIFNPGSDYPHEAHTLLPGQTGWPLGAASRTLVPLGNGFFRDGTSLFFHDLSRDLGVEAAHAVVHNHSPDRNNIASYLQVVDVNGLAMTIEPGGYTTVHENVPNGATPLGSDFYLVGNDLYWGEEYLSSRILRAATTCHTPPGKKAEAFAMAIDLPT